ncbi:RNA 2'-phosphotransferase [Pontibacter sp. G13]|uniref:RNA 2'-phosphotransferase n=1 Tax=Pontibacter sp. G13 TaxID=3074898 RepID=UPI00288C2F46|nr:RNA 2'-phosphotransferase [Pontibacter sp. G13]WNJ17656.1 RNA 2'-phosphotransferase [Pontibacter sp. G13]
MNPHLIKKISKLMSWGLRHKPEELGVELSPEGWTPVQSMLSAIQQRYPEVVLGDIHQIVLQNDKKRFVLSDDQSRIRAAQGHSVTVNLGYEAIQPPDLLFHGTAKRFLESIAEEGLQKRSRHHVHLSKNVQTARQVGSRHGQVVVLEVDAERMQRDGFAFFKSDNGVWLTDSVPSAYIMNLSDYL